MDTEKKYTIDKTTITIKYCIVCNKRLQNVYEDINVVCSDCFGLCKKCKFYFRIIGNNRVDICNFCL